MLRNEILAQKCGGFARTGQSYVCVCVGDLYLSLSALTADGLTSWSTQLEMKTWPVLFSPHTLKSWDEELERTAHAWAQQCIWDHGPSDLIRSIGQNLAVHWGRWDLGGCRTIAGVIYGPSFGDSWEICLVAPGRWRKAGEKSTKSVIVMVSVVMPAVNFHWDLSENQHCFGLLHPSASWGNTAQVTPKSTEVWTLAPTSAVLGRFWHQAAEVSQEQCLHSAQNLCLDSAQNLILSCCVFHKYLSSSQISFTENTLQGFFQFLGQVVKLESLTQLGKLTRRFPKGFFSPSQAEICLLLSPCF